MHTQGLAGLLKRPLAFLLAVLLISVVGMAAAQAAPAAPAANPGLETGALLRLTGGLFLVIIVIVALSWFLRRYGGFAMSAGGQMRILGSMALGGRERMVLVEVGDRQLLLGVAPGRVQTLLVLDEPIGDNDTDARAREAQAASFAERLRRAMQQQHGKR